MKHRGVSKDKQSRKLKTGGHRVPVLTRLSGSGTQ